MDNTGKEDLITTLKKYTTTITRLGRMAQYEVQFEDSSCQRRVFLDIMVKSGDVRGGLDGRINANVLVRLLFNANFRRLKIVFTN